MKYRKKPVVIDAWKLTKDFDVQFFRDLGCECGQEVHRKGLIITTLEGDHLANVGDWVIKGVKGEFYPCKPDIFEATYELMDDTHESK